MKINDLTKLKITKIRDYRVNFRYDGVLYSLNNFTDGLENVVALVNRDTYTCCGYTYDCLRITDFIKTKYGYLRGNSITYSHVDKEYFVAKMIQLGFVNSEKISNKKLIEEEILKLEERILYEEYKIKKLKEKLNKLKATY